MMLFAIWNHLHYLKILKKHPWGSAILVKLKVLALYHGCFSRFLNFTMVSNHAKDLTNTSVRVYYSEIFSLRFNFLI